MVILALWLLQVAQGPPVVSEAPEAFVMRVVATGLENPWELVWGADGRLWVTERSGRRVTRVHPQTGVHAVALTIDEALQTEGQDGVLGLTLQPGPLKSVGDVFVSFTYDADPGPRRLRRLKVRRYTFDPRTETLTAPTEVIDDLPGGDDHVSGRLAIGPDQKLYLSVGDQGGNHLLQHCTPNRAQELPSAEEVSAGLRAKYEGKVLRLNLDGSVPADNPVIAGVRSHIYSYGHRNAQGLAFAPDGHLYASEHGPSTDDELNLVRAGGNYGWPYVAGARDDRGYVYANWSASSPAPCPSLQFDPLVAPSSVPQQKESAWTHPDFVPPLRTFFTVDADYRFREWGNATVAPSGLEVYTAPAGIPGWSSSLLMTSLLRGSLLRVRLNVTGGGVLGETTELFRTRNRYRDVAVDPDGQTIYVAVDSTGSRANPGAILAFTHQPPPPR